MPATNSFPSLNRVPWLATSKALDPIPIAARSASHGRECAGEERSGARRSMTNRYQWLNAAERVQIGTLEAVSTWHS